MSQKIYKEDDYLTTANYQNKEKSQKHPEFSVFSHDGQSFFALMDSADNVVLRSEGYATTAARDKGMESVLNNKVDETKWSIDEKMGYFFLILKAANHQEIGRSSWYKSKEEAELALSSFMSIGNIKQGISNEISDLDENENLIVTASSKQSQDILKSEDKEDDYLSCDQYKDRPISDKNNNVALFKHENGQYYFALYDAGGNVKIRSEGFETAMNRDQELSGVLKYHNDESMYTKLQNGKYYMMVLRDKKGTEVGRSCLLKEEDEIKSTENVAVASSSRKVVSSRITNTKRVLAVEDDYLKCDAYKGHTITDTENNIALFTSIDNQLYFVVYNPDGSVRLRSEGFMTEVGRDNELQATLEHMNDPNMYTVIKKGKYSIKVLKDSLGREVARSCMYLHV